MTQRFVLTCIGIVLSVGACVPSAAPLPTATPFPTIEHGEAWTPQIADFDGVAMALVPPGCFTMGTDDGRRDERPPHEICFDAPFWIDVTEVTNAAYGSDGAFPGADLPRGNLLWQEARDHCAARGARLPTEAEWEYAARGGDDRRFPWGDDFDETRLSFDRNSGSTLVAVGTYPDGASWVGALDMSGNAFEWVASAYTRYPYDVADGREDPNVVGNRVYRSGRLSYDDHGVSTTIRFRLGMEERDWFLGFRCAKSFE